MNENLPERAAVLADAVRLAESTGLTVLGQDCEAGGHRVDLVALTGDGTLIVMEVTAAPPGVSPASGQNR
jgi:hypothetical protein